jgi:hypothetical protein
MDTQNEEWKFCCSNSNSQFVKYMAQLFISLTVLFFCIAMIIIKDGDKCDIYFSLISGIIGIYSPQPQIKK